MKSKKTIKYTVVLMKDIACLLKKYLKQYFYLNELCTTNNTKPLKGSLHKGCKMLIVKYFGH
jgi:hypothetical protein